MNEVFVDVREKDEYLAEHIPGSINLPLTDFDTNAPNFLRQIKDRPLVLICRSGNRAKLALSSIRRMDVAFEQKPTVFVGGITEWKNTGNPTIQLRETQLPIMRQVQLAAGLLVLLSLVLAWLVHPFWLALAAFVGIGLTTAGLTGFCGMGILLAHMPWNKIRFRTDVNATKVEAST